MPNTDTYNEEKDKVELDKGLEKDLKQLDATQFDSLAKQVQAEWKLCWDHQKTKKEEDLLRLKLYNNQRRNKDAAGDTTMFTIHQTLLSSLYTDVLTSLFVGREEGDDVVAENLTRMAEYDYEGMMKDIIDYDWDWDTLFFSRGIVYLSEYVRDTENKIFLPVPEVVDPTTFLRDPRAVSIRGNTATGKNSARFFGREIRMTKYAMEENDNFFKSTKMEDLKFGSGTESLIEDAVQARTNAQGYQYDKRKTEEKLGVNAEYDVTEWHTYYKVDGEVKKVKCWLGNQRKMLLGAQVVGKVDSQWKAIDRPLYPTSHTWDGVSIPDLTEDKQRHRAVAQNLGMKALTSDLYPNYIYDQNKIKNKNDLKFGFNKFIPVDGDPTAILPMRKYAPNLQLFNFIYESLQLSAEKATATPDIQQGIQSSKDRPLGETNAVLNRVDTRYSLAARVFAWSERAFWQTWYSCYKDNFPKEIDTKIIRVAGAFGDTWRPLGHDNIIAKIDPDVKVESTVVSRARQLEERQSLTGFFGLVFADPTANKRYGLRRLGKLFNMKNDEMDRLLPPTIDERQAEDENELLNEGKMVRVLPEHDHNVHLEIHSKAKPGQNTTIHIETHKHALSIKKTNPELFPTAEAQADTGYTPPGSGGATPGAMPQGVKAAPGAGMMVAQ